MRQQLRTFPIVVIAALTGAIGATFVRPVANAAVPVTDPVVFRGRATNNGVPLTGDNQLDFRVYPAANAAEGAFSCQMLVTRPFVDGNFTVPLNNTCLNALAQSSDAHTEVRIAGVPLGRQKVNAVPYAVESRTAVATPQLTDWADYNPTVTGHVYSAIRGKWRRVGDTVEVNIWAKDPQVAPAFELAMELPVPADISRLPRNDGFQAWYVGHGTRYQVTGPEFQLGAVTLAPNGGNFRALLVHSAGRNVQSTDFMGGGSLDVNFRYPAVGFTTAP